MENPSIEQNNDLELMIYKQLLFELSVLRESLGKLVVDELEKISKNKNKLKITRQKFFNIVSNLH